MKQPLIFIDTYERLQAAQELRQQKIATMYAGLNERLTSVKTELSLQDWLERFLEFCQQQGALILIAGRKVGSWQHHAQDLERFKDEDILNLIGKSAYPNLQALLDDGEAQEQALALLKQLSFGGIPLWLQLALNFINLELREGQTISGLARSQNVADLFAQPLDEHELNSLNVDKASCKLALFNRVMQHNLELADDAWKMALPRYLDDEILTILFTEQAQVIKEAFVNAGLLPSVRWTDKTTVRLHEEVRDLLLAYARYKQHLESENTKQYHHQIVALFTQRYQTQQQISFLLEQLYHQAMSEETINLDSVKDPDILFEMAIDLENENQNSKKFRSI